MTEIEKAFALIDETKVILRIGEIIWEKSKVSDDDFSNLTEPEKTFIYIDLLEGQVNNGGFDQFFFNSSGSYTYEAFDAFQKIGAEKTATIIHDAIQNFPASPIPKDTETRRMLMEDLDDSILENWNNHDVSFYEYEDNVAGLLIEYLKVNYK